MSNKAFNLVQQSIVKRSVSDDDLLLEEQRITCDKELPPIEFLFRVSGKPCFPRGEVVMVTGKAKSGKTDEVLFVQRPFDEIDGCWVSRPVRCLWFDTEQSDKSTQEILMCRMKKLIEAPGQMTCNEPWERYFDIFNVRKLHYDERLRLFEKAVRKYEPALVVLDGVRDLLADINDGVKAQEIVERLMKLAQETNSCIVCVLHQNKSAEDRNPRGWIGTELMNKAFEVYSCEKVKPENIFVVEQTLTRKYDFGRLLFFRMDSETELPVVCDAPVRFASLTTLSSMTHSGEKLPLMNKEYLDFGENNKPIPKKDELFYEALKAGPLFYSDMQQKVQSLLNCSTQMWNNMFCEMRDHGAIIRKKNNEGKYVWQLAAAQPDLLSETGADTGDSPSS